jgi:hypothetical protein
MATKLPRTIGNSTPLNYAGRLRYFNPAKSILDFDPSKRDFRRVKAAVSRQVATLSFYDLNTLVASKDRQSVYDDFMELQFRIGEPAALDLLRAFLVENHLCNLLVRLSYDPTKPFPGSLRLLATQLFNAFEIEKSKARQILKRLHRIFRFSSITPAIQLPQVAPNAPNTLPAFSLVAA